jgi:hypothetical protein
MEDCVMKKFLFAIAIVFVAAQAFGASLVWDPNTETDLAGYRVYYSTDNFATANFLAETTDTCYPLDKSQDGYYFALTAFDFAGNESARSAVVRYVIPEPPDTTPPFAPANPRINLDADCPADVTLDGTTNVYDVLAYNKLWLSDWKNPKCNAWLKK